MTQEAHAGTSRSRWRWRGDRLPTGRALLRIGTPRWSKRTEGFRTGCWETVHLRSLFGTSDSASISVAVPVVAKAWVPSPRQLKSRQFAASVDYSLGLAGVRPTRTSSEPAGRRQTLPRVWPGKRRRGCWNEAAALGDFCRLLFPPDPRQWHSGLSSVPAKAGSSDDGQAARS